MSHVELGKYNQLEVVKEVDFGLYLEGDEDGEILLPKRYVPEGCKPGDWLNVFIYLDMDERLVATTLEPYAQVGEFACLQVAWTNEYGAFLDWGLMKDLFVPFREQKARMEKGRYYVVYVHLDDESYRIMATAKVERYLSKDMPGYTHNEEVEALVWQQTDLGWKVIVENQYAGMLFKNEVFRRLQPGMKVKAFVKQVREDGKIDLVLQKGGMRKVEDFADTLLAYLQSHEGRIPFTDKSDADDIYATFGVSKKTFKKAVGDLYKKRLVALEPDGIALVEG